MPRLLVLLPAVFCLTVSAARAEPPLVEIAHQGPVWSVAWSPDGKALASAGQDGTVRITAIPGGKEISNFRVPGAVKGLAFAPDGKTLALKVVGESLRLHNVATGQALKNLGAGLMAFRGAHLAFSADGTAVLAAGVGERLYWQHTRGGASGSRMGNPPVNGYAAVAPDGSRSAWGQPSAPQMQMTDASGRNYQQVRVGNAHAVAFAPDGKTIASGNTDKIVRLWDFAGQEVRRFEGLRAVPVRVAFSANGKVLAAIASGGLTVHVWDVERGRTRRQLTALRAPITDLAISPDGKRIATAGDDGKARVWNIAVRDLERPAKAITLSTVEMERLWEDLAAADHARAEAAFRKLAGAGDHAVPFLRERLRRVAVPKVEDGRIQQLLRDLDARTFAVRQKATLELAKYGELAEAPLRKLLASRPPAEAEKRATMLLDKLKQPVLSPERTRALEGIELLAWLRSPEARRVLAEIARDGLIPRLREEAAEALQQKIDP